MVHVWQTLNKWLVLFHFVHMWQGVPIFYEATVHPLGICAQNPVAFNSPMCKVFYRQLLTMPIRLQGLHRVEN
jgi:hypothetical protein